MKKDQQSKICNKSWELAPDLVIQLVLSKLPYFCMPRCRLVCKTWNDLILTCKHDPSISTSDLLLAHIDSGFNRNLPWFRNIHCLELDREHLEGVRSVASFSFLPKYSTRDRCISIINACTGLLSLRITQNIKRRGHGPDCVCILNPMTNEYFNLPMAKYKEDWVCYFYGFGFSPKTKKYKVARNSTLHGNLRAEIFAIGTSRKWTPVGGSTPYCMCERSGVYFNGGLHWIGLNDHSNNVIYRLDMEDEKFEQISFPQDSTYSNGIHFAFAGVFNGALHLTLCMADFEYEVWKMEEHGSWVKTFVVFLPENIRPLIHCYPRSCVELIKACEDGKILCLWAGADLLLYNPKTERMEKLTDTINSDTRFLFHKIESFNFNTLSTILSIPLRQRRVES